MSSFLTQCPHCLTPFRVTEKQLDAAEGRVRCGACLGIFSAEANRIKVKPSPDELAAADAHAHEDFEDDEDTDAALVDEADDSDVLDDTDDAAESDDHEPVTADAPDTGFDELDETEDDNLDALDLRDYDIPLGDLNLDVDADDDEEDEEDEEDTEFDEPEDEDDDYDNPEEDEPDEAVALDEYEYDEESATEAPPQNPRLIDIVYEEYLDDDDEVQPTETDEAEPEQSDEFEPEFVFEDDDLTEALVTRPAEDARGDEDDELEATSETVEDEDRFTATSPAYSRTPDTRGNPNEKAALHSYLADIEDDDALDPLEDDDALDAIDEPVLLEAAPRRSRLAGFALLLANLVLIGVLVWQYADENIERLGRSASLAPVLPYLCRVVDCPEPQRSQPDLFVSEQLLVRSHPRYAQALEVNLVFRNDAPEAQPFPALELGFHDPANRMVANRLFQPAEYLPPELQTSEMPAQSSIQVTLELVDPGSDAVNYTLGFRAP